MRVRDRPRKRRPDQVGRPRLVADPRARAAGAAAQDECAEYPPARVKQAVCGYGRAEKAQVQRMVRAILALETNPTPNHASDALAVAICHALAPPLLRIAG